MRLKTIALGLLVLAAALVGASAGATGTRPAATAVGATGHQAGSASAPVQNSTQTPAYCNPCLYYSGDFSSAYAYANALTNENDLVVPTTRVYTPVTPDVTWSVTKLFINTLTTTGQVLDPTSTPWEIRSGVSEGDGGTLIASGSSNGTLTATGRTAFGFTEYTLMVTLNQPVVLTQGVTYWINVMPQCTNDANAACNTRFYESDSDPANPANHTGPSNILDDSFLTSAYFGVNFSNTNHFNVGAGDFRLFSFGLVGSTGGTLTVTKHLITNPADPAKFNLRIDGTTYAANVGDGGTTGAVVATAGTHTVSETAGLNANLGNYTTRISCSDGSAGYGTTLSGVHVEAGGSTTCTITNTRKLFRS